MQQTTGIFILYTFTIFTSFFLYKNSGILVDRLESPRGYTLLPLMRRANMFRLAFADTVLQFYGLTNFSIWQYLLITMQLCILERVQFCFWRALPNNAQSRSGRPLSHST